MLVNEASYNDHWKTIVSYDDALEVVLTVSNIMQLDQNSAPHINDACRISSVACYPWDVLWNKLYQVIFLRELKEKGSTEPGKGLSSIQKQGPIKVSGAQDKS